VPTNYPNGNDPALGPEGSDDFQVTTNPANTPLSQPGENGNRHHTKSHIDMGDAIEALQANAALKTHDHSGLTTNPADRAKGYRLSWANTHQTAAAPTTLAAAQALADTDDSALAIHHTLATNLPTSGTTGQFQAAQGNHTHDYDTLTNSLFRRGPANPKPSGVPAGTLFYETDTGCVRQLRGSAWVLTPLGRTPIVRLRQSSNQNISSGGTLIQWNEKEDDTFGWISGNSTTSVTIQEPGLYRFDGAIQWSPNYVPDNGTAVITVNSADSDLKVTKFQKLGQGIIFPAGFPQTLSISGCLRITAGQTVALKCSYSAPSSLLGFISSWFDSPSKVKSRLDITYVAP
jgi:hypothetical protein